MTLAPDQDFGPYTLIDQIAVGGMAEIYLAKTKGVAGFEKVLALKVIHPNYADDDQFIQMLIDEAKISVGLNHANICQIFDLGQHADTYYISMEFIDGYDLFKIMRRLSEMNVDVPIECAVYVAQEICCGLDYAHRCKAPDGSPLSIVHRDISPQNILLSKAGEVKIVDFGIAKAASRGRKTQAGVIKGKYFYMSPEQAWGDPIDHRTDIFSAGIILYEVLTGQMLYLEEDLHKLLDMVRKADIPRPSTRRPEIPRQLETIVMKALAKRPSDRWQTAHEFQVALTNFLYGYAPDFTPERLSELVEGAMGSPGNVPQLPPAPPITEAGDVEILIDRDEVPLDHHSVIFDIQQLVDAQGGADADDSYDPPPEDPGESTRISGPPEGMFGFAPMGAGPEMAPEPAFAPGDDTQADLADDPTQLNKLPEAHDQRQLPRQAEVIVPAEVMGAGRPHLQHPGMTPTPVADMPPHFDLGDEDDELTQRGDSPEAPLHLPSDAGLGLPPAAGGDDDDAKTLGPEFLPPRATASAARQAQPPQRPQRPSGRHERPGRPPTAPLPTSAMGPSGGHRRRDWPALPGQRAPRPTGPVAPRPAPVDLEPAQGPEDPTAAWDVGAGAPAQSFAPPVADASLATPGRGAARGDPWEGSADPWEEARRQHAPPQVQQHAQQQAPQVLQQAPQHLQQAPAAAPPARPPQPPRQPSPQPPRRPTAQVPGAATPHALAPAPPQPANLPPRQPPQPRAPAPHPLAASLPGPAPQQPAPAAGGLQPLPSAFGRAMTFEQPRRRGLWVVLLAGLVLVGAALAVAAVVLWPVAGERPAIVVTSVPEGATVFVDGRRIARRTPVKIPVSDAKKPYTVKVTLQNHEPYDVVAKLSGDPPQVQIVAPLTPMTGRLLIDSKPRQAQIYINGDRQGQTPKEIKGLSLTKVTTFELRKRGYEDVKRTVSWDGRTFHKIMILLKKSK